MTKPSRSTIIFQLLALLAVLFVAVGAQAQDDPIDEAEETEENTGVRLFAEISSWVSQASGLDFSPATQVDPGSVFGTQILRPGQRTQGESRYRAGVEFGNFGEVVLTWYAHRADFELTRLQPGEFIFGTTLAHPLFAGFSNDGLADGFKSDGGTRLRDIRLDFYRTAFQTSRLSGKWFGGYRRVSHDRSIRAEYAAILPALPASLPFNELLFPGVESGSSSSSFEGRGPEAGMDFRIPIVTGKIDLEAGFSLAVLRGKIDTEYRSITNAYILSTPPGENPVILSAPYDEFSGILRDENGQPILDPNSGETIPLLDFITQSAFGFGLKGSSQSTTNLVEEVYLGFRWKAWRTLEVFGGFRSTRYSDIGRDTRATVAGPANLQGVSETIHSATYEGLYGGASYVF